MFIQKIHLQNFQRHSDLQIDFVDGLNILFGESGTGKTCIKHALEFLCLHDTFNGQRKIGTKTTSVKGWFSNGVIVERIVSNSINRYILTKDGKESVFDSVGKSSPIEVQEAIGIYPLEVDNESLFLNSRSQIAVPFLYEKSPSFRAKIFNKITGSELLDQLFGKFNKDIRRNQRELKEETKRFEEREKQLISCKKEVEKAEVKHEKLNFKIKNLKSNYENYSKLLEIKELQEKNRVTHEETAKQVKTLKFPQPDVIKGLKEKISYFDALNTVKTALEATNKNLMITGKEIKEIALPRLNVPEIQGKLERFDTLKSIYEKLDKNREKCYTFKEELKNSEKELITNMNNYKELLKEVKVCPICQNTIDEKHLEELDL